MFKTFIFDFDMTLVDSLEAITQGLNKIAGRFNLSPVNKDQVKNVISLETKDFWKAFWGRYDEAWATYFMEEVVQLEKDHLQLAEGAMNIIESLKKNPHAKLALATNRFNAWRALSSINLDKHFDAAFGVDDVKHGKPAPDMLLAVLEQLETTPEQAVYVGDAVFDMEAARAAGIKGIGLLQGGANHDDLVNAGAWRVCHTLNDVHSILELDKAN